MKYFVGQYDPTEPYRVRLTRRFRDPLKFNPSKGKVIWRGDDLAEGQEIAKQANDQRKAERLRKKAPLLEETNG